MPQLPWTPAEDEHLRQWWPHIGHRVARDLERTENAAKRRAYLLGLNKFPRRDRLCHMCRLHLCSPETGPRAICRECIPVDRKTKLRLSSDRDLLMFKLRKIVYITRHRSKKKGMPCDLSLQDVVEVWHNQGGKCAYSGLDMTLNECDAGTVNGRTMSIDRIVPSVGYTKENVVLCCLCVNRLKGEMDVHEMMTVAKAIVGMESSVLVAA